MFFLETDVVCWSKVRIVTTKPGAHDTLGNGNPDPKFISGISGEGHMSNRGLQWFTCPTCRSSENVHQFIKFVDVLTMLVDRVGLDGALPCFAKEYELSRGASTERTEGHLLASEIPPVDIADLTEDGAELSQGKSAMGCQWARSSFEEALDEIRLDMWPQSQQLDVWILSYSVCCCIDLFDLKKA